MACLRPKWAGLTMAEALAASDPTPRFSHSDLCKHGCPECNGTSPDHAVEPVPTMPMQIMTPSLAVTLHPVYGWRTREEHIAHYHQKCKHGVRATRCWQCGGSEMCKHKRRRERCTLCGVGREICEHGRRRSSCGICGRSLCECGKRQGHRSACTGEERDAAFSD
jgi:hypothetical protein